MGRSSTHLTINLVPAFAVCPKLSETYAETGMNMCLANLPSPVYTTTLSAGFCRTFSFFLHKKYEMKTKIQESGVYAGMLYGFLESVWNTPPTPIPSEVVVLKAPPKSDWARKTATTMATRGGMAGVSMATFVLTKVGRGVCRGLRHTNLSR